MARFKVLITTSTFAKYDSSVLDLMKKAGIEFQLNPFERKLTEKEIVDLASDMDGLIAGTESLNSNVIPKLKNLKVISRCGAGLDNVDLMTAEKLGIKVFNTPDAPTQAVAELTLGLILDCLRHISQADREIRHEKWYKPMGQLLEGKTVGIIGYGRIGKAVAKLIQSFNVKILVYDIIKFTETAEVKSVSFDDLVSNSEIISLHMPANKDCIIDSNAIAKMKTGAYLINAARGGLVDENALYEALKSGKLAGAGIDVFEKEPYQGKLIELDNIILTSHIGSYAKESRILMEKQAIENLIKTL